MITGRTRLGARNRIFQFASIGEIPQDRKYGGEPTTTTIGDDNVFREFVTIHAGTAQDRGDTAIGNGNLFLAYTHVAHDCVVGNQTIFSNNAQIAGHVHIGDWVVLGAYSGVHQFCRVGAHAMLAAGAIVLQDVPPFVTAAGYPAKPRGTNNEGLRRRGFAADDILAVRRAYKTLYREGRALDDAKAELAAASPDRPRARYARRLPRRERARHHSLSGGTARAMPDGASRSGAVTIGIVAGEASGDALAATLIGAVRARLPQARFVGVAGPRMEAAGCEAWYPLETLSVRGLVEVLSRLPQLFALRRALARRLRAERVPLFIGVDAPDFNLGLEARLKRAGVRTVHFVSPSVWAWRRERVAENRAVGPPDARAVPVRAAALPGGRRAGDVRRPPAGTACGGCPARAARRASS